jgi:hypothetical protein
METKSKCFNGEYEDRCDDILLEDEYDSFELERINPPDPIND